MMKANSVKKAPPMWREFFKSMEKHAPGDDSISPAPYISHYQEPLDKTVLAAAKTVLIVGDTGTGKELMAEQIVESWQEPLPAHARINCSVYTPQLMRSELFGYVKGAVTDGLPKGKPGLVEGLRILFLDEFHTLDPEIQPLLLRLLQYRQYQPIGGAVCTLPSDFRIIAAAQLAKLDSVPCDLLARFQYKLSLNSVAQDCSLVVPLSVISLYRRLVALGYSQEDITHVRLTSYDVFLLLSHDWSANARAIGNFFFSLPIYPKFNIRLLLDLNEPQFSLLVAYLRSEKSSSHMVDSLPTGDASPSPETIERITGHPYDTVIEAAKTYAAGVDKWHKLLTDREPLRRHHSLLDLWELSPFPVTDELSTARVSLFKQQRAPQESASINSVASCPTPPIKKQRGSLKDKTDAQIMTAVREHPSNNAAAAALGVCRETLSRELKKRSLSKPSKP
jgi:DNA-binding NtrC family response regulator